MNQERSILFDRVDLGQLSLPNRIVMSPMTRSRAGADDAPTADMVEYYRQRAGAGLIVTEGVHPSPNGKGYHRMPGIHTSAQIEGWRAVAEAVHAEGGRIVMQLMHCGRAVARENQAPQAEVIAPSAIRNRHDIAGPGGDLCACPMPRAVETEEIPALVEEFRQAAANAMAAGMDGVELHGTSGYLPMQFLSPDTNVRTDAYGGSPERRARFVVEVMEALAQAAGPGRAGLRINPGSRHNDMHDPHPTTTYSTLLAMLRGSALSYVHLIYRPALGLETLSLVRDAWDGPVIVNDQLTAERAEALVKDGRAEAVSFGRAFISNPDLVDRLRHRHPLAVASRDTFYVGEAKGYIDYLPWSPETPATE